MSDALKYEARDMVDRWRRDVSMQPPEVEHLAWERIAIEVAELLYDMDEAVEGDW